MSTTNEVCFDTHMIVYEKDNARVLNYQKTNQLFNQAINKYSAIDTINEYQEWSNLAIKKGWCTERYLQNQVAKEGRGKLGCNLSHLTLYQTILNSDKETLNNWHLILEDDVGVDAAQADYVLNKLSTLVATISRLRRDTKFVQLCVYSRFVEAQQSAPRLFGTTHIKIPQWGTCAYLIHIDAMRLLLDCMPWDLNIDYLINSKDSELKSLCYINSFFYTLGSEDSKDRRDDNQMGSLIWNSRELK
jgi:GR25 family glycosyltransferase involved in LPS biosynthesis